MVTKEDLCRGVGEVQGHGVPFLTGLYLSKTEDECVLPNFCVVLIPSVQLVMAFCLVSEPETSKLSDYDRGKSTCIAHGCFVVLK